VAHKPEKLVSASASLQNHGTILRMWKAQTTSDKADEYGQHAKDKVFPRLWAIEGHCGAYLLRRRVGNLVDFVVLTLWESMDSVRKFAGLETAKAVVEPEARAALTSFDDSVTHFEVVYHSAK
jgi:heme-degrading monooxygenase HmoA